MTVSTFQHFIYYMLPEFMVTYDNIKMAQWHVTDYKMLYVWKGGIMLFSLNVTVANDTYITPKSGNTDDVVAVARSS